MALPSEAAADALGGAPKAILATIGPDGRPNLVPIVFALLPDGRLVSAVDQKPKRTRRLQRLQNIRSDPRVTLLVDHYGQNWDRLWWIRIDAVAEVCEDPPPGTQSVLTAKYAQYRVALPTGPWIVMEPVRYRSWSADPDLWGGATS